MNVEQKHSHHFKAGYIVHFYGARFQIVADARESNGHRSQAAHLITADGPSDCATAIGKWVSGEIVPGYFGPNKDWNFQGNFSAGTYKVEILEEA